MCISVKLKYWNLCILCNNRNAISLSTVNKWAGKVWVHVISILSNSESTKTPLILKEEADYLTGEMWRNTSFVYFSSASCISLNLVHWINLKSSYFIHFCLLNSIFLSVSVIGRFRERMKLMATVFFLLSLAVPFTME